MFVCAMLYREDIVVLVIRNLQEDEYMSIYVKIIFKAQSVTDKIA